MFRTLTLGISALSILATPIAAIAQNGDRDNGDRQYQDGDRDGRNDDRRDDRRHDDRRYDRRDDDRRDDRRGDNYRNADNRGQGRSDWRSYRNYDYNRPPRGQNAYYADQYYRDGRYYQPRRLGANDRIYRGRDNRYYCRRSDGTTGLVIGALGGGVLGNVIASGGSNTLGTVLGAVGGGLLGRSIDRNNVTCR